MSADVLFLIVNRMALVGWVLLAVLPRRSARLIAGAVIPLLLSLAYALLLAQNWGRVEGGFGSLEDVVRLFSDRWMVLIGWIHYLAFDLFLGAWQVRDGQKHGIPHLVLLPCLFATLMFGPVGLVLYFTLRVYRTRSLAVE